VDPSRLKSIDLFAQLPDEDLKRIATLAAEKSVGEDTELARQGEFAYDMFAIEEGEVEVRQGGNAVATLGPGDVVGEAGVLRRQVRNADVVATKPTRIVILSHWDVKRLRKSLPDLDERLSKILSERGE
jgi:CRP/FNR family transcriptional regulator, cyclic AMP receptor protein